MLLLEAFIITPKKSGNKLKCSVCAMSYSVRDYLLLYKSSKIIYFNFRAPKAKRKTRFCHECLYAEARKILANQKDGKLVLINEKGESIVCAF